MLPRGAMTAQKFVSCSGCRSMKPSVKKALLRMLILLVWVFGGAWIFIFVEYKEEDDRIAKGMIMTELYHNMSAKFNMTPMEFENLAETIHDALTIPGRQWSYENAIAFALHTVTTIGYGDITPTTPTGQILCILYALTGIPIAMLALKSVGGLITEGFTIIIRKVEKKLWKTMAPKHVEIKCIVVAFVSMMMFIMIGTILQVYTEDLTYVEGIYMWFITFTTVGYGDYYPGKSYESPPVHWNDTFVEDVADYWHTSLIVLIEIANMLFYIFGLSLVASVLNSIASVVEKHRYRKYWISRKYKISNKRHNSRKTHEEKLGMDHAKRGSGVVKDQKADDGIEPRTDALDPTANANSDTMSKSKNSIREVHISTS